MEKRPSGESADLSGRGDPAAKILSPRRLRLSPFGFRFPVLPLAPGFPKLPPMSGNLLKLAAPCGLLAAAAIVAAPNNEKPPEGAVEKIAEAVPAKAYAKPKKARKVAVKKAAKGGRRTTAARQQLLVTVERAVKHAKGMSASQVASTVRAPQSRVASALRELKVSKRIFQGGDRRFARYAGDARTAQTASLSARKTAAGPRPVRKQRRDGQGIEPRRKGLPRPGAGTHGETPKPAGRYPATTATKATTSA